MTRKQAISKAIDILMKDNNNQDVCVKLQEILNDLPMSHWSEEAIFDAFNQYILDNNRLPSKKEVSSNPKLPTHSTVKNRFGITLQEFFYKYYSDYLSKCKSRIYWYRTPEEWQEYFKYQYRQLECPTMETYDKIRDKESPSARHLIKICGYSSWNELLYYCDFPIVSQSITSDHRHNSQITVNDNCYWCEDIDKIKAVNDKLEELNCNC